MVVDFVQAVVAGHPTGPDAAAVAAEVKARQALRRDDDGSGGGFDQKCEVTGEISRQLAIAVAHEPYAPGVGRKLAQLIIAGRAGNGEVVFRHRNLYLRQVVGGKVEGDERGQGAEAQDGTRAAEQQQRNGLSLASFVLQHDLAARAAGQRRAKIALNGAGSHGHTYDGRVAWLGGREAKQRGALSAQAGRVSRVFLVGAPKDGPVGEEQRGPYVKAGIGRVSVGRGIAGGLPGSVLGSTKVGSGIQFFIGNELLTGNTGHVVGLMGGEDKW